MSERCPDCDRVDCPRFADDGTGASAAAFLDCTAHTVNWRERAQVLDRIFERLREMHPDGIPSIEIASLHDGRYSVLADSTAHDYYIDGADGPSPSSALAALAERLGA